MLTYRFRELQVALDRKGEVREALARELRVHPECIFNLEVERFSLDCRRKGDPKWNYNVIFDVEKPLRVSGNAARREGFAISARGIFTKSRSAISGCGTVRSSVSICSVP